MAAVRCAWGVHWSKAMRGSGWAIGMSTIRVASVSFAAPKRRTPARTASFQVLISGTAVAALVLGCAWTVYANVFAASPYPQLDSASFDAHVAAPAASFAARIAPLASQTARVGSPLLISAPATVPAEPSLFFSDRFAAASAQGFAPAPLPETPKLAEAPTTQVETARQAEASKAKGSSRVRLAAVEASSAEYEINAKTAYHDGSAASEDQSDQLFGLDTETVTEGPLLEKWRRVEAIITKDLELIVQCQAAEPCPAPAQKLINLSRQGTGRSGRARIGVINRAVNLAIRPVSDETQWGIPDRWSEPLETLHSNSGDCEDYAIVKYAALLAAGLPKDAVKIVVLRNRLRNEDHAVVAIQVDHQWLILDNRTLTLVRDTDVMRATPEFVLDDQGVRRFVWSSLNRRVRYAQTL
jgi:predicted transglutaminase-like cysteine proteinase